MSFSLGARVLERGRVRGFDDDHKERRRVCVKRTRVAARVPQDRARRLSLPETVAVLCCVCLPPTWTLSLLDAATLCQLQRVKCSSDCTAMTRMTGLLFGSSSRIRRRQRVACRVSTSVNDSVGVMLMMWPPRSSLLVAL